uniref:Uncharacterized protein n=1 Tax=Arundo donax TaxID=35708 RepID=A0A0A8ZAU4_ARUDO
MEGEGRGDERWHDASTDSSWRRSPTPRPQQSSDRIDAYDYGHNRCTPPMGPTLRPV